MTTQLKKKPISRWTAVAAPVLVASVALLADKTEAAPTRMAPESEAVQQIQRYCNASWRNANIPQTEWADCSQQAFSELLERIDRRNLTRSIWSRDSAERCELNRAIWRIVQRWVRATRMVSLGGAEYVAEISDSMTGRSTTGESSSAASVETMQDSAPGRLAALLRAAADHLSPRQREILTRIGHGHSIGEVSEALHISRARVSDEKYRAIQKIRRLATAVS